MQDEPKPGPSNWRSRSNNRSRNRNGGNQADNFRHCNRFTPFNKTNQFKENNRIRQTRQESTMECNDVEFRPNIRGGRGSSFRRDDRSKFIGFRTLEEIAQADEKDVLQKINEKREAFMCLVNSPIDSHDVFVLLIEILSKISQSPFVELKSKLIWDVCNSNFISYLRNYLLDLPYVDNKSPNNLYWKDQTKFWNNFITFCEDIVNTSPSIALKKCRALIESISKTCLEYLNQRHAFVLPEDKALLLDEIRVKMTTYGDKYQQPEGKRQRVADQEMQPPENFRVLSVVPTRDDLLGSKPFLRPNVVDGAYQDVEHYLDVQFRLLREDCFGPFRDGINQFLGDPNKRKYDHVRIFHNVRFLCPYVNNLKVGAVVQIDMTANKNFERINWAHNKRFLFGSLVLFTKDHCRSFISATILDRDLNLLSSGKLPVSIIDIDLNSRIYNNDTYTMIESEVYFEPYFHVMKALQESSFPQHLAMQQYIVKVNPASKYPAYLTAEKEYIIRDDVPRYQNIDDEMMIDTENVDEVEKRIKFKVLQPDTWPTKEALDLDESQYEAYRLALTHEFAVIQGPPGTGKTYIGVKVAKTLLHNIKSPGSCLMLIICYTNHALDQFLEAISKITQSIVRIGAQSRNKALDKFNLTNLRKESHTPSLKSSHGFFIEQKINLRESIELLQKALKFLDILNNGVVSYRSFVENGDLPVLNLLDNYYKNMGMEIEDPLEYWLFEAAQGYSSDYSRNIEDCLSDYNIVNNEDEIDEKRKEIVLDDDNSLEKKLEKFVQNEASFLLSNAKSEMRKLVSKYNASRNFNERHQFQLMIRDLDSRINLFNDMVTYRHREIRLNITHRTNFSSIAVQNRWCLYFMWIHNKIKEVNEEISRLQTLVSPSLTAYDEARMMMDVQLLKERRIKVVGMTTTGAARMRKLLQAVAPKIVIVEEAAEVLEQHIITSLTQDCQHVILIGDHQQLRPSASHIKLAKQYDIEVSLFERMITNGIHSRRLNVQHRMRPEIAALISPHIYPELQNHPSVETFPCVPGIANNIFFFTHDYAEENLFDSNSRANHKEADMALALANYLMQQGYTADDITILAAYSGQMFYMRKERQNYPCLSHVKITVVDNYQGEESKIIILSLVRNNSENSIGFLGTENRICVALSRAKQGFYIFGNINMLKAKSELWRKIATTLESNGSLGTTMTLKCQNHPQQITLISTPEDFSKLPPEGGCFEKCNYQYHCGHMCLLYCHGYDREHISTKCTFKCERVLCDLGHVCPLKCQVDCEPCKVNVMKTLPCGHEMDVDCHREPEDPKNLCLAKIDVTLPNCGHKAQKYCHEDINKVKCSEKCVFRLEMCGHVCARKCHVTHDPDHEKYICLKPCARAKAGCVAQLIGDRGDHQCRKTCNEKCDDCNVQVVKKRSTCKHLERVPCSKMIDEIPCKKKCARIMSCGHYCKKRCVEKCGDCKQMVVKEIPECKHKIKVQCMIIPSRDLCKEKCTQVLTCGHPCKDLCGVPCDSSKCTELTSEVKSPCGHNVKLPCNVSVSFAEGSVELAQVAAYCGAACGAELACGHACAGTCARCHHARLHVPCASVCARDNICGHQCLEPCNQICPPCKMFCEVKCPHSHCKKLCGEPCVPCKEKCNRRCPHGACSRLCGEPCSLPPCDEHCPRLLACGHACRGLCGEPCPDVCRICLPEQFPTGFLGEEYEDDDKFILLQDCGHIFEVQNMDNIMLGSQENIKIRTCPLCRKAIINTNRYKDTVNDMFKNEINPIKEQVYGTPNQISGKIKELLLNLQKFKRKYALTMQGNKHLKTTFLNFIHLIRMQKKVSLLQVEMQCIYLNIFELIVECWQKYQTQSPSTTILKEELEAHIAILIKVLKINSESKIPIKLSAQQQKDIGNEIKRLNAIVQFSGLLTFGLSLKNEPNVKNIIKATKDVVFNLSVFDEDKALESLKGLKEVIKSSGVISKYERSLIVKAIDLKAGHWFKCPNGHFYCIGECGGANQVGQCADCGASIGGRSHALLPGNTHAPEMDGSRYAAYSEQSNMANFNIADII